MEFFFSLNHKKSPSISLDKLAQLRNLRFTFVFSTDFHDKTMTVFYT